MAKKFEDIIEEIKKSIEKLESNEVSLDNLIKEYEKTSKLIKEAEKQLNDVEKKFEIIKKEQNDGTLSK